MKNALVFAFLAAFTALSWPAFAYSWTAPAFNCGGCGSGAGVNQVMCTKITTNATTYITKIGKDSTEAGSWAGIFVYATRALVDSAYYVNYEATMNSVALTANTAYYVCSGNYTGTGVYNWVLNAMPLYAKNFNLTEGFWSNNNLSTSNSDGNRLYGVINITFLDSLTTTTELYLDGSQANASGYTTHILNSTAVTTTGYNVSIYINGTESVTNETTAWNYTALPVGLWNITAAAPGNATRTPSSATWWYTSTLAPSHPLDTHICFTIRDVCIDTLSNRVWIGGRPQ